VLIRAADYSIDAQYYMWHLDVVGRLLIHELLNAANRGVRVRLLVDDMYGTNGEETWLAMDAHPNIEVHVFAPYSRRQPKVLRFLTRFHDVNVRMHTKTFTVDALATVIGGRNIVDEYCGVGTWLEFADNDVLAIGTPVQEVAGNIRSVAFEVDLVGKTGGSKSLRWQGGEVVSLTSEPYVGLGTKTAARFMRLFPVSWLLE